MKKNDCELRAAAQPFFSASYFSTNLFVFRTRLSIAGDSGDLAHIARRDSVESASKEILTVCPGSQSEIGNTPVDTIMLKVQLTSGKSIRIFLGVYALAPE